MITEKEIEIRYAETDKMGVVYHANYLVWFEMARTQLCSDAGYPYTLCEEAGFMSPVVEMHVKYGVPMTFGQIAVVRCWLTKVSAVRLEYGYEVYAKGEVPGTDKPHVTATSVGCMVDAKTFRPVNMKKHMPEFYAASLDAIEKDPF